MGTVQNLNQKVIIRDEYLKKDGTCPLYLYVSVDGKWTRIPLRINWPPKHFDKPSGKLKARQEKDQDYTDYNLIIATECAKINEIFKSYRLAGRILTTTQLEQEYYNFRARNCFLRYFERESRERYKRRKIEKATFDCNQVSLNKLNAFWVAECNKKAKKKLAISEEDPFPYALPFNQLSKQLLENFASYCKN